ncbi:2-keto-3-deoxygluconate permease, partial [Jeotgalibaca porci]
MIMKFINKVPAGIFIVPLVVSMILFTFFPNLFRIGGITESFLSANGSG